MYECSEVEDGQQDDPDAQAVELSIVILVDGEEKCCSKVGRSCRGARPSSSNRAIGNVQSSHSRPTTPTAKPSSSSTSLPSCCNRKAGGPVCANKRRCPQHGNQCPYEENVNHCGNCGQPRIIPTPQSTCPCAALQNAPCGVGAGAAPLERVKSQTAACQTISHGECQTDPQVVQSVQMQVQTVASGSRIQTASCQTGAVAPVQQARPCTPKRKKVCQKKAKSAICQTQAQPMSRPQTAEQTNQTMVIQNQVCSTGSAVQVQAPTVCAPPPSQTGSCTQVQAPTICQPIPVGSSAQVQQSTVVVEGGSEVTQTTITVTSGPDEQQAVCPPAEQAPPMEEPGTVGDTFQKARSRDDKVRKVRRSSKEEKLREPAEARKAKRSSLPPDQLNFTHFPPVQLTFVDYFLKSEGGMASVITLAETKLEYEKKCKSLLANMPNHKRSQAEEYFNKIIEAVQVKFPESNNTEIKHYHLVKYLQPIVTQLQLQAQDELHVINKYHSYILSVVNFMEDRLRERQVINPDAMVDVETHLLAGIMSRVYPIFIKMKILAISLSTQKDSPQSITSEDFIKQLRKLILASYVEIICIDVTFNNTLTSLTYLPSIETQEKYRHQLAIRMKHARHSVTWAARCITTAILYYYVSTAL